MPSIEEIEKRRADRKAAAATAKQEQLLKDMEALDALEVQYGDGRVARVNLATHVPGLPTFIVVRAPTKAEGQRMRDMVRSGEAKLTKSGAAADMLATSCLVYPDAETYKLVLESFPGVHGDAFMAANDLGKGKAEEEGKG